MADNKFRNVRRKSYLFVPAHGDKSAREIVSTASDTAPEGLAKLLGWTSDQILSNSHFSPDRDGQYTPSKAVKQLFTGSHLKSTKLVQSDAKMIRMFYEQNPDEAVKINPGHFNRTDRTRLKLDCSKFFWQATTIVAPLELVQLLWKQLPPRIAMHNPDVRFPSNCQQLFIQ
jgi:hypothetical protein